MISLLLLFPNCNSLHLLKGSDEAWFLPIWFWSMYCSHFHASGCTYQCGKSWLISLGFLILRKGSLERKGGSLERKESMSIQYHDFTMLFPKDLFIIVLPGLWLSMVYYFWTDWTILLTRIIRLCLILLFLCMIWIFIHVCGGFGGWYYGLLIQCA